MKKYEYGSRIHVYLCVPVTSNDITDEDRKWADSEEDAASSAALRIARAAFKSWNDPRVKITDLDMLPDDYSDVIDEIED